MDPVVILLFLISAATIGAYGAFQKAQRAKKGVFALLGLLLCLIALGMVIYGLATGMFLHFAVNA